MARLEHRDSTQIRFLGVPIDLLDSSKFAATFVRAADAGQSGYVCVTNVHQLVLAHDEAAFGAVLDDAAWVIPDSTVLNKAIGWQLGSAPPPSLRGDELTAAIARDAAQAGVPVALIGGRTDEVLARLAEKLLELAPGLEIAFRHSPPFRAPTTQEEEDLRAAIASSGAKIVFVGLGCPKQENWMATNSPHLPAMLIGVGAAFDFLSGEVTPAPGWVHRMGLEWLARLVREPRRLWRRYATTNSRFLWLLATEGRNGRRHA